jgi:hypothetical protein
MPPLLGLIFRRLASKGRVTGCHEAEDMRKKLVASGRRAARSDALIERDDSPEKENRNKPPTRPP